MPFVELTFIHRQNGCCLPGMINQNTGKEDLFIIGLCLTPLQRPGIPFTGTVFLSEHLNMRIIQKENNHLKVFSSIRMGPYLNSLKNIIIGGVPWWLRG